MPYEVWPHIIYSNKNLFELGCSEASCSVIGEARGPWICSRLVLEYFEGQSGNRVYFRTAFCRSGRK